MFEQNNSVSEKCAGLWEKYKILIKQRHIRRMGIKRHGICNMPINMSDQNVLEHAGLVTTLCGLLEATFEELEPYFPPGYMLTMLLHDAGETRIGDIPDDGSADAAIDKDEQEYDFLAEFVKGLQPEKASNILANFSQLQKKNNIFYLADKLEWIFFVGSLTPSGDAGSLDYKREYFGLTRQDEHAIEMTDGSTRTVDAMVVHFMEHSRGIAGRDIFVSLVEAMYMDIDGYIPAFVGKLY